MKRISAFLGAAVLAVSAIGFSAGASAEIKKIDTVSDWDIIIDTSVGFGCAMQAEFDGDAIIRMGFNKSNGEGYIMVLNKPWTNIKTGQDYKVDLNIDNDIWNGDGKGIKAMGTPGFYVPFDDEDFFLGVMKKHTLSITHQGKEASFSLAGTNNALKGVLACQEGVDSAK